MLLHRKKPSTGCLAIAKKYTYNSAGYNFSHKIIVPLWVYFCNSFFVKGGMFMYIYRTSITTKDGSKIYAKDYGKRAFRIWVGPGPEPVKSN